MKKIDNFSLALAYLKKGLKICRGPEDYFLYRDELVSEYKKGSRFSFPLSDFQCLFAREDFYLPQDICLDIDPLKDEEYYSRYHK